MKKEEKTKQTYKKIVDGAIKEFGTKPYDKASINSICQENQIAKGLIYHNFKNKDELYLCCVEICFREMMRYLREADQESDSVSTSIEKLMERRQEFFKTNPYFSNIFFHVILQPPVHLEEEIREIRRDFDCFYRDCCEEWISKVELREGITADTAMGYFIAFQEMFNGYFQMRSNKNNDFHRLIEEHEFNISRLFDIVLYGIAKEPEPA